MSITVKSTFNWDDIDPAMVVRDVLEKEASKILDAVKSAWPTDSGQSARSWAYRVVNTSDGPVLHLTNSSGYAGFIKVKGGSSLVIDQVTSSIILPKLSDLADKMASALTDAYSTPGPLRTLS